MQHRRFIQPFAVACSFAATAYSAEAEKPNVVIVIADDQAYGDVTFTGNPAIRTGNFERNG